MAKSSRSVGRLRSKEELRELVKFGAITALSTVAGLLLRYGMLYFFSGSYELSLFGRSFTLNVDDNLAYTVYYISSTILMYLLKWFTGNGLRANTFVPRMIAFAALSLVSMLAGNVLLAALLYFDIHGELAFWLTCPFTFLINYLGCRLLVFGDEKKQRDS